MWWNICGKAESSIVTSLWDLRASFFSCIFCLATYVFHRSSISLLLMLFLCFSWASQFMCSTYSIRFLCIQIHHLDSITLCSVFGLCYCTSHSNNSQKGTERHLSFKFFLNLYAASPFELKLFRYCIWCCTWWFQRSHFVPFVISAMAWIANGTCYNVSSVFSLYVHIALNSIHNLNHVRFEIQLYCLFAYKRTQRHVNRWWLCFFFGFPSSPVSFPWALLPPSLSVFSFLLNRAREIFTSQSKTAIKR